MKTLEEVVSIITTINIKLTSSLFAHHFTLERLVQA